MATPLQPLYSFTAQGSVGPLTYCNRRIGPSVYAKSDYKPPPPTAPQEAQRRNFQNAAREWHLLSLEERSFWEWYARRKGRKSSKPCMPAWWSGYNAWSSWRQHLGAYDLSWTVVVIAMYALALSMGFPLPIIP